MADQTDKITDTRSAARPNSARVTSGRSAAGLTLSCDNLAGWPTDSKVHFVTYQIDSNSNPVAGTQLDCSGIVSSNDITSLDVIDGSDTGNSVGDVVEMLPTAAWGQDLADALTREHDRTGKHTDITADTIIVTDGTTLPAGDIGTADIADGAITNAKLKTTAGELGGVWNDYAPTYGNVTPGNGAVVAKFTRVGQTVHVYWSIVCGSTTTLSNPVLVSLPVAPADRYGVANMYSPVGNITANDTGGAVFQGWANIHASTTFVEMDWGNGNQLSGSFPFVPSTGDTIVLAITYEADS